MNEPVFVRDENGIRWEGPPVALIHVELLGPGEREAGELVELGPFIVCLHRYDFYLNAWEVYRVDSHGWLLVRLRGLGRWLTMVGRRLILTLAVWRLAEQPLPGCYPSWEDVRRRWRRR